jgi:hypothetical protein
MRCLKIHLFLEKNGVWNKGLKKEIDSRVAKGAETQTQSRLGMTYVNKFGSDRAAVICAKKSSTMKKTLRNKWSILTLSKTYPIEFDNGLKSFIRNRDRHLCQLCEKTKTVNGEELIVHHIDYNKYNINPENLISLCRSCHAKTNKINLRYYYSIILPQLCPAYGRNDYRNLAIKESEECSHATN